MKKEYKLHGRRSVYQIALTSYPGKRAMTDLENQLKVRLTKHDGHTVKFTQQQAGNLPWFSIDKLHRATLQGNVVQKWHLKLHNFRTHWNRAWSGMTCAWLKISVAEDCYIRIKITYDKEKRRKTKKLYNNKQRKKKVYMHAPQTGIFTPEFVRESANSCNAYRLFATKRSTLGHLFDHSLTYSLTHSLTQQQTDMPNANVCSNNSFPRDAGGEWGVGECGPRLHAHSHLAVGWG